VYWVGGWVGGRVGGWVGGWGGVGGWGEWVLWVGKKWLFFPRWGGV
jgi:hypothetical protein